MLKLVIDIAKGRPKGSTNKDHKWIARYTNARGEIVRVYPDKEHGELLENGQFKLKPGVTISQIIHDKLYGGIIEGKFRKLPGLGKRKTELAPATRDGEFVRYEVVSASEYRKATKEAADRGYDNPFKRDAITTKKVGDYYVFGYPKTPAVEHKDDKPVRWAGYVNIEYHPSVKAVGYRTPQKVEQFQFHGSEVKATEAVPARSFDRNELPVHGDRGVARASTVHPVDGRGQIALPPVKKEHDLSTESLRRQELLDVKVTDESDPLEVAAQLYDKVALKAKQKPGKPGTVTRANFHPWQLAKYHDQQELLNKLQHQQVAALISLGVVRSTKHTRKLNAALVKEWTPIIMGLSGDNYAAFKETADYLSAARKDAKRTAHGQEARHVKRHKQAVVGDLFQIGMEKLLRLAHAYEVEPDNAKHRFDKLAYASIANELRKHSRIVAEERGTNVPIIHQGEVEAAMRANARGGGSMESLSPHEAAELKKITPLARHALYEAVSKLPDAYHRVVAARLWLDEPDNTAEPGVPLLDAAPSEEERLTRKQRQIKQDARIAAAEEKGEVITRDRRKPRDWEREWTGPGSIAEKHRGWVNPETGEKFDINEFHPSHQRELLQTYYRQGVAQIIRQLSVPITRPTPKKGEKLTVHPEAFQPNAEWKQRENHVIVPLSKKELERLPAEAQLAYVAAGGEPRVLTQAGKAVKRYLQIETKLATQNRRRWMAPGHVREVDASVTFKPTKQDQTPSPRVAWRVERVLPTENQAVRWFASSSNQELAARLGMHDLAAHADTPHQRNVSPGRYAENLFRRARKHYKTYNEVTKLSEAELRQQHTKLTATHNKLLVKLRKPMDDDAHRAMLSHASQVQARLHIIDFVRQTKQTTKSLIVSKRDTITSLVKAFFDYDFELDRLWVEFA